MCVSSPRKGHFIQWFEFKPQLIDMMLVYMCHVYHMPSCMALSWLQISGSELSSHDVVPIKIRWSSGEINALSNTPHWQRRTINLWSLCFTNIMFVRIPGYSFSPYSQQAELQLMEKRTHVFSGCADALIGIRRPVWMSRMKHQWLNGHWLVFGFCMLGFWSLGKHFCIGFMAVSILALAFCPEFALISCRWSSNHLHVSDIATHLKSHMLSKLSHICGSMQADQSRHLKHHYHLKSLVQELNNAGKTICHFSHFLSLQPG